MRLLRSYFLVDVYQTAFMRQSCFILLISLLVACTRPARNAHHDLAGIQPNTSLSDTKLALSHFSGCQDSTNIIAYNEHICISDEVFVRAYTSFASVAPIKDSQKQRIDFLEELINRQSVAYWATEMNQDQSIRTKRFFTGHLRTQLAKQWVKDEVEKITKRPSEHDIREAFYRSNTRIAVEQIFAPTSEQIIHYHQQLEDGANFKQLAKISMIRAGTDSSAYNMGWIEWRDLGLGPESVAYALDIGEISEPVSSLNGWHIFRLTNKEEKFYADASTFENNRESLQEAMYARMFEENSTRWIDSVKKETPLSIQTKALREFEQRLFEMMPNSNELLLKQLSSSGETPSDSVFSAGFQLAKINGHIFTSEDFISALPQIPESIVQQNLQYALEMAVLDFYLSVEAQKKGYLHHPTVFTLLSIARQNILYDQAIELSALERFGNNFADNWFSEIKPIVDSLSHNYRQDVVIDTAQLDQLLPYFF